MRKYHKPDIWHLIWWQILIPCELDHQEITLGNKVATRWHHLGSILGRLDMQEQSQRAAGGADKSRQSLAARFDFELSVQWLGSVCSVWQCAQLSVHCSSQRALGSVHTSVQCLGTLSLVCRVWAALLPPSTAAEVELSMPALHSRPKELAWWKWLPWKNLLEVLPWGIGLLKRTYLKKVACSKDLVKT